MDFFTIEELIPQRQPFIMVDKLESYNEKEFSSSLYICPDNYFAKKEYFQEEGLIENMAQTAAAGAGYSFLTNKEAIKLGYIGAIKNVTIHKLPEINSKITTIIKLTGRVLNIDLIQGDIYDENNQLIASAEMKIFIES